MKVILSVDVEMYSGDTAEIWGGGLGLDYILSLCRRHGVRATFFVEALGVTQWGDGYLKEVCRRLLDADQDVQLHVHPGVARLDGLVDREDTLWEQDYDTQVKLIAEGRRILERCGVPSVRVFRAGDLAADEATLKAMATLGIPLGSNRDLDRKSSIHSRINACFPVVNDVSMSGAVTDIPVTVMRSALRRLDGPYRHFEITALSAGEMTGGLLRLQQAGYAAVTILTHPGEFFRRAGGRVLAVEKNRRRLEHVIEFVAGRDDMVFAAMGEIGGVRLPSASPVIPILPPLSSLRRLAEQAAHRVWARRMGVRP
jgi:hypothetical protein